MGLETDFNVSPYYDDFDENKNFHRVLFKPAVPLQAREITQLQTILQNQIERFGQFQFKEGSIIKGCGFSFDDSINYAKINDKTAAGTDVNVALFGDGDYIKNSANVVARIVDTKTGLETQSPDLNTLFFHYINTGTGGEKAFEKADEVEIYPASTTVANIEVTNSAPGNGYSNSDTVVISSLLNGSGVTANVVTIANGHQIDHINVTSNGSGFSIDDFPTATIVPENGTANGAVLKVNLVKTGNVTIANSSFEVDGDANTNVLGKSFQMSVQDGIIFQKGNFQRMAEQNIIVSKYTSRPNELVVGIATNESIVNNSVDTSLLDNASGFANENAPGADRLKLEPVLVVNTKANAATSNNFLKLVEFQHGAPIQMQPGPVLNNLGKELAKRTYEESGDYVVEPFSVSTENRVGNTTHLSAVVGAGIGYVKGQRFEIISPTRVPLKRANTTNQIVGQEVSMNYGNFVTINEMLGEFGTETNDMVQILDTPIQALSSMAGNTNIDAGTSNTTVFTYGNSSVNSTGNVIGTARARSIETLSAIPGQANSEYNLYLFDIKMNAGKSFKADAKAVFHYEGSAMGSGKESNAAKSGVADLKTSQIKDRQKQSLVFPLGQVGVKEISNTASYVYKAVTANQFSTSGVSTITLTNDNFNFGTTDSQITENQERDLIIVPTADVSCANIDTNVTTNSNTTVTAISSTSSLSVGDRIEIANSTSGSEKLEVRQIVDDNTILVNRPVNVSGTVFLRKIFQEHVPISLGNRTTRFANVTNSGKTLTINLGETLSGTLNFNLTHNIKDAAAASKTKGIHTTEVAINTTDNNGGLAGPWNLGVPDAFELLKVYVSAAGGNSTTYASGSGDFTTDRTDKFEILDGQKDGMYAISKLRIKPNSGFSLSAGQNLVVKFRNFTSTGDGFFTYQSYHGIIDDANTANTSAITTQEIPLFESPGDGKEYSLRDSIDFRPRVEATANSGVLISSGNHTVDPSGVNKINADSFISCPDKNWIGTVTHYLPRKDRIVIEKGQISIVEGVAAVNPQLPVKPLDSMQLATIDVPVFPSLDTATARFFKRPDLATKLRSTQLKRYTMRDIKQIDKRVNNLEYYTSLNMLEKMTSDAALPSRGDSTLSRFKNGFIVDNFATMTTGNPLNDEFKAGFDKARKLLTARFEQYNIGLKFSSGIDSSKINDVVMTSGKDREILSQNKATQDRRCTSAFWQYNGTVRLFPDYFSGTDVKKSPESAIQIDIDVSSPTLSLLDELNKIMPVQITGEEVLSEEADTRVIAIDEFGGKRTTTHQTIVTQQIRQTTSQVVGTEVTTTKKVGEFVTDISFQPYIPGMDIRFVALGLRPGLQHFVYFDDVNVTADTAPATITNVFDNEEALDRLSTVSASAMMRRSNAFGTTLTANSTGGIAGVLRLPAGKFFVGERKFAITDISNLSQVKDTVSAATTRFNAYNFAIEKGDITQSTRSPELGSAQSGRVISAISSNSTFDVTVNTAIGNTEPTGPVIPDPFDFFREPVETPIAPPPDDTDPVTPPRPPIDRPCVDTLDARPWKRSAGGEHLHMERREINGGLCNRSGDPLAQTFLLQPNMFRGSSVGYLTSLDLFFSAKDPRLGTIVEIRETINGAPGPKVLPFSRVRLKSSAISTSTDASSATRINFRAPVAVETDKEYCFVILPEGNSPEYKVWTAKAGQKDISNNIPVNQDWGVGTLFLSTNNRTWTEYVDEDCKFRVNAEFFDVTKSSVDLVNEEVEFIEANNNTINGTFTPGEEVFKLGANITGTAVFTAGNNIVTGTGTSFTGISGLGSGSKIVLQNSNSQFDVVEVAGVTSDTVLTLRGAPDITAAGVTGKIQFTPTAIFEQVDNNTGTLLLNHSTASSASFLFANGDTLIGCSSSANTEIGTVVDTNISYLEPRMYNSTPDQTAISTKIKGKKADASGNSAFQRIATNDRNYLNTPIKLMSKSNEIVNNSGAKSILVRHILSSDSKHTSPMVDLQSQGFLLYENIIANNATSFTANTTVGEHIPNGGLATAKYVSRLINLDADLDAEDIKVFVNAYKPAGTDIEVYARILNEADDTEFADRHWSKLEKVQNKDVISSSENRQDVVEYSFEFADSLTKNLNANGTVTFANSSTTITGSGTLFDADVSVGDLIQVEQVSGSNTEYFQSQVTAVASNTSLTVADTPTFNAIQGLQYHNIDNVDKNRAFRDPGAPTEFQVTYYNADNEKFVGYNRLAIKIVMSAESTASNPYLQDYRAIAVSL